MTFASSPTNSRTACPAITAQEFYVRKDSGINKVEDLKGKVIGTNGGGSAVDVAMRAMLKKHGLEEKRDYTMVEARCRPCPRCCSDKKADLVPAVLPFAFNPKLRRKARFCSSNAKRLASRR